MGSQQYNSRDLQKITPELGDGYIIEYRDILIKILGDILPKPKKINYDENNNIYEIYFLLNSSQSLYNNTPTSLTLILHLLSQ